MIAHGSGSRTATHALLLVSVLVSLVCLPACRHIQVEKPAPPPAGAVASDNAFAQIRKLTEVMLLVKKLYVEERDFTNMIDGALGGMLQSLDEHSHHMPPTQFQNLRETTSAQYSGIGIQWGMREGMVMVVAPIEGSPAYKAGLLAQDVIIKIDGENTAGMSRTDLRRKMRGKVGTILTLAILRGGDAEPRTIKVTRGNIRVPTVKSARIVRNGIGYVRVTQFSEPTAIALQNEIDTLRGKGTDSLILDLRSNPGGLLRSAKDVAQLFLPNGALVVSIRDRNGKKDEKRLVSEGPWHDTNTMMVVLIDGGSASASEIVAGALQDQKRAVLVGEKSYGKGSVQSVIPLASAPDTAIRLTTAKYYTPSERVIHERGIEPDIRVRLTIEQWRNVLLRREIEEHPANFSDKEKEGCANSVDLPLERAADLLQALRILRTHSKQPAPVAITTNAPAVDSSSDVMDGFEETE